MAWITGRQQPAPDGQRLDVQLPGAIVKAEAGVRAPHAEHEPRRHARLLFTQRADARHTALEDLARGHIRARARGICFLEQSDQEGGHLFRGGALTRELLPLALQLQRVERAPGC